MYQNTRGVQVRDFLEANEARLKDKHFLYVVSTNLEEDTYLRRRNTRGSKDGINVKIGMSQSGVTARLKSYTHMSSNFDPRFPQSGIRVLFLKQFPRRKSGETGSSIVARVETRLKQILREMDRSVDGRGSEVFRIQPEELFQIIEDIGNADASYEPRRQSERFGKNLLWMITDSDTGKQTMMFAEDYDEVLMRFAEDNDVSLLDERSKYITRFYIRRVGSVPRQSRPVAEAMSQPMTEDSTVNFSGEPLTEGQGESSHKRRREEPRLNIKNLRPWDKGILLQELVADRDEREAQRRFAVPGTSGRRRDADTPLETRRLRPWDEAVRTKRRMENPPQEPPHQRRTIVPGTSGLRRDAESPLDEDDRSNKKRIVTPGTSGLRRDPDYSRPAGGSRRPAKVLKK
jgi:hypothetical protein